MENIINANAQKTAKEITKYDVIRVLGKTGHMILLLAEVAIATFLMSIALTFEGDVPARLTLLASGQAAPTLRDLLASPLLFTPLMVYAAAIQAVRCITGWNVPGAKAIVSISKALALATVGCTTVVLVFALLKQENSNSNSIIYTIGLVASPVLTVIAYRKLLSFVHNAKLLSPANNPMLIVLLLSLAIYVQGIMATIAVVVFHKIIFSDFTV